jgi:hypothetical protein
MNSETLIKKLIEQTEEAIGQAEKLKNLDMSELTWRSDESSWNILECIEHLNLYGDFYLPVIEDKIRQSNTKSEEVFKTGLLGNYFAKSMLPKEKLNKMTTFKDKNPLNEKLDNAVLDKFLNQQIKLLGLLNQARNVSLNKVKTPISITTLIKLRLGDTFRFLINHNIRHLKQIEKIQALNHGS